jgi:hypothetical protein
MRVAAALDDIHTAARAQQHHRHIGAHRTAANHYRSRCGRRAQDVFVFHVSNASGLTNDPAILRVRLTGATALYFKKYV